MKQRGNLVLLLVLSLGLATCGKDSGTASSALSSQKDGVVSVRALTPPWYPQSGGPCDPAYFDVVGCVSDMPEGYDDINIAVYIDCALYPNICNAPPPPPPCSQALTKGPGVGDSAPASSLCNMMLTGADDNDPAKPGEKKITLQGTKLGGYVRGTGSPVTMHTSVAGLNTFGVGQSCLALFGDGGGGFDVGGAFHIHSDSITFELGIGFSGVARAQLSFHLPRSCGG